MRYASDLQRLFTALLLCAASVAGTSAAHAHDGAFTFKFENDTFTGTDNNYTNGFGFTLTTGEITRDEPAFAGKWLRFWSFLPFVGAPGFETFASWALVHEVHTPTDISLPNPREDDQPYAGILYTDSVLHARNDRWAHTWSLRAGIVGPSTHAERVQRRLHKLLGSRDPMGWDTQLPDEPVLNIDYTTMYAWREGRLGRLGSWRIVPVGGVSVGNYFTGVSAGAYGEIGWKLSNVFRTTTLRHGFNGTQMLGASPVDGWSVSFFAGVEGYGVAHYLPLDGTVLKDSRRVESKPFTSVFSTGLTVRRNALVLSLTQSFFTKTFDTEQDRAAFGTLNVSWYRRGR